MRTLPLLLTLLSAPAFAEDPPHGAPAGDHGAHSTPAGDHGAPAGDHSTPAGDHGAPAGDHGAHAAPGGDHGAAGNHGAAGDHGEGAHGEGAHGGAHHVDFVADDDHDGTANWMDGDSEAYTLPKLAQHLFNLIVLFALIAWFGGRAISDALKNRAAGLRSELEEAAALKAEAERRHAELTARLQKFDAEVSAMRAAAAAETKEEETKLIERANNEAARIQEQAERTIREELTRARTALRNDAVDLAVKLAEGALAGQVQADDQKKLAKQFLDALNGAEVKHG